MRMSTFAAEVLVGLEATKMGLASGFNSVILEGDSLTVIKKSSIDQIDTSEISAFIRDIKGYRGKFHDLKFRYVSRRANIVAYALATEALRNGNGVYLVRSMPSAVQLTIADDYIREPD